MVTRYTGGVSQLPAVEISWGDKSKKKPMVLNNFCFLLYFELGPGHRVTWYIGGISWLLVVEMSWGKKSKEKTWGPEQLLFSIQF